MGTFDPPAQYLRDCSDTSLRCYEVSKLEHVANLRRELRVLWEEMLEESALAHLARWMIENRADLRRNTRPVEPALAALGEPPPGANPSKMSLGARAELEAAMATPAEAPPRAVARRSVLAEPARRGAPTQEKDSWPSVT